MNRVNLTLDPDTYKALESYAKRSNTKRARLARELISEALVQRQRREQRKKLAQDYAAAGEDTRRLLADLENAQLDLLDVD